MKMMVITRLYPENASVTLWNSLLTGLRKCDVKGLTPLYISQRDDSSFTSIISDTETPDAVMELFESDSLGKSRGIRRCQTILLAKPKFFTTYSVGGKLHRYHFDVQVKPSAIRSILTSLRKAQPTQNAALVYLACSFSVDDIIGSMVAKDYDSARELLITNFGDLTNIIGYKIARVARSKRLVDDAAWKKVMLKYAQITPEEKPSGAKELDWTLVDEALITGAFERDMQYNG